MSSRPGWGLCYREREKEPQERGWARPDASDTPVKISISPANRGDHYMSNPAREAS